MNNNFYYNKYIKYKNKYFELKQKTSKYDFTTREDENKIVSHYKLNTTDLEYIINLLCETSEYCGILHVDSDTNELFIDKDSINKGKKDSYGRLYCANKKYDKIIWHTHPKLSKYFPSTEDILKILKNSNINQSFIFTSFGYWALYYYGELPEHKINDKTINIKRINDLFYFKTQKGREYNKDEIDIYISNLKRLISNLSIYFFPYHK